MWTVTDGPIAVAPLKDHRRFRFTIERAGERRDLFVEISGTAGASDLETLASPIREAVETDGLDAVERYLNEANTDGTEPPATIEITTTGEWARVAPSQ